MGFFSKSHNKDHDHGHGHVAVDKEELHRKRDDGAVMQEQQAMRSNLAQQQTAKNGPSLAMRQLFGAAEEEEAPVAGALTGEAAEGEARANGNAPRGKSRAASAAHQNPFSNLVTGDEASTTIEPLAAARASESAAMDDQPVEKQIEISVFAKEAFTPTIRFAAEVQATIIGPAVPGAVFVSEVMIPDYGDRVGVEHISNVEGAVINDMQMESIECKVVEYFDERGIMPRSGQRILERRGRGTSAESVKASAEHRAKASIPEVREVLVYTGDLQRWMLN
jgi:hypothetical protein